MEKSLVQQSKSMSMSGKKSTEIISMLDRYKLQLTSILPKHISPERMIQMTTFILTKNPALADCSVPSVIGAMMQASILGFQPADSLGQCYFVPYGGKVQFQIGYKGYIDLARRSKSIKSIYSYCVYSNDIFDFELGLNPRIYHKPNLDEIGEFKYVYAVAHYTNGGSNFVILTKKDVEKLRLRSPMQKQNPTGAWNTDYYAMAQAKAIKQLAKFLPLSLEIQEAMLSDENTINPEMFQNGKLNIEELSNFENIDESEATNE